MNTAHAMAGQIAMRVESLGMSQRQFADLVGASTKHVCCVFNGKTTAHLATLDRWAEALGMAWTVRLIRA